MLRFAILSYLQRKLSPRPELESGLGPFLGDLPCAIADFDRALEVYAPMSEAYRARGDVSFDQRQFDSAIGDYSKALQLNPNDATAYANRGSIRVARGDVRDGLPDLSRAIELDPTKALAYANRGWERLLLGDELGADQDFARCFNLDPTLRAKLECLVDQTKKTMEKKPPTFGTPPEK